MRLTLVMACLSLALYLSGPGASLAAGPYQWNLDTVYDDRQHWGSALSALVLQIDALEGCTGRLSEGGDVLTDCLQSRFEAEGLSKRSRSWAELQALDGAPVVERVENWNQALAPLRGTLERFDAAAARVGAPVVNALPVADLYRAWFTELWRNAAHIPAPPRQAALLAVVDTARPFGDVYEAITREPLTWPRVTLSDGRIVRVDPLSYPHLLWRRDADDRHRASDLYWVAWGVSLAPLAVNLNGRFQADARIAAAQGFDTTLDAELFRAALPHDTLSRVRHWTDQAQPTLGTWFRLRSHVLATGDLYAADMHVPLGPVPAYSLQNAREIVVEALAPLHGRASRLIDESFDSGWLQDTPGHAGFVADVGPGYHPYIGIDYRGDVLSLLELARLWGIALHRHFSDVAQPDAVAGTWPLLDDTVGTVAELLVLDYLNRNAETEQEGLGWLSVAQDFWYRRFFLPAANADFERTLRDRAAAGDPFPVSWLNQTFDRTLRRVHPASVRDDNAFRMGWAAESGLYSPYGNLRQALATAAAAQLADGLLRKGGTAPTAFRALLAAGRSEPAAVLLAGAGIDLGQDQAFEKVLVASKATISLMTAMVPEFAPETTVNTDPEKHEPARQELLESPQPDAEKPGD